MGMPPAFIRSLILGLLAILALDVVTVAAPATSPDTRKGTLFPGAKLMHKFPKEVYRVPVLVTTDKGPRLEVWFDAFDPEPPPRPGQIPGLTRLPDPRIDLLIWDPIANKQLHKLSYPQDPIAFPYVSAELHREGGMAISPDGKWLASKTITYAPRGGSPYGDFTTRVKLIDIKSRKVQLDKEYKQEKAPGALQVYLLFAPDGALVTLQGTTCTIQEPGKERPRMSFELTRAAEHKTKEYWFKIQDVVVSPDGSQLAVAADGTIVVYDLTTGKKLFAAARAAAEPKKGGDPFPGNASLAYAPSANDAKLLAVETVVGTQAARKDFVLARQFDLKNLKEMGKWSIQTPSGKGGPILGDPNGLAKRPGRSTAGPSPPTTPPRANRALSTTARSSTAPAASNCTSSTPAPARSCRATARHWSA